MNILEIIKSKIKRIHEGKHSIGIEAVIIHIEIAEKYYYRAKQDLDDNLFTDVIYRTNHAFEGILKEAYCILTKNITKKITPFEIEKYLSSNNIFKVRVLELFSNYRIQWRNTSTHDYKLFFTEQEAFLAIINVSSFVNILLDQIIEKLNIESERNKSKDEVLEIKNSIANYDNLSFADKLLKLIAEFGEKVYRRNDNLISEMEYIGLLTGFILSIEPDIKITIGEYIDSEKKIRPDMIVNEFNNSLIIELKRTIPISNNIEIAKNQVLTYLTVSGIQFGVIIFLTPNINSELKMEHEIHQIENTTFHVYTIFISHNT